MAKNRRYAAADAIPLPVAAGVVSGQAVLVGELPGVALTNRRADGTASVECNGAFNLEVTAAAGAIAVGDPVFIDAPDGDLSNTNTGDFFGYALEAVANAATATIAVKVGR